MQENATSSVDTLDPSTRTSDFFRTELSWSNYLTTALPPIIRRHYRYMPPIPSDHQIDTFRPQSTTTPRPGGYSAPKTPDSPTNRTFKGNRETPPNSDSVTHVYLPRHQPRERHTSSSTSPPPTDITDQQLNQWTDMQITWPIYRLRLPAIMDKSTGLHGPPLLYRDMPNRRHMRINEDLNPVPLPTTLCLRDFYHINLPWSQYLLTLPPFFRRHYLNMPPLHSDFQQRLTDRDMHHPSQTSSAMTTSRLGGYYTTRDTGSYLKRFHESPPLDNNESDSDRGNDSNNEELHKTSAHPSPSNSSSTPAKRSREESLYGVPRDEPRPRFPGEGKSTPATTAASIRREDSIREWYRHHTLPL